MTWMKDYYHNNASVLVVSEIKDHAHATAEQKYFNIVYYNPAIKRMVQDIWSEEEIDTYPKAEPTNIDFRRHLSFVFQADNYQGNPI